MVAKEETKAEEDDKVKETTNNVEYTVVWKDCPSNRNGSCPDGGQERGQGRCRGGRNGEYNQSYHAQQFQQLPTPPSQGQGNLTPPLVALVTVNPSESHYFGQYGGQAQSVGGASYMTSPTIVQSNELYMANDGKFY